MDFEVITSECRLYSSGLARGQVAGPSCERSNENWGSIKWGEFIH